MRDNAGTEHTHDDNDLHKLAMHTESTTMTSQALITASAAIILMLGLLHLLATVRGRKVHPREPALETQMRVVSPVITRQTTMWKAWVGFNASHSCGAILFGSVYGYLAVAHSDFLFQSVFLLSLGLIL